MKKGWNTPTISSVNKSSQDPASLRDKIQKLSSAVNELRHNVVQEDSYLESLQQSNMKNYSQLNQQIQILKKSFNSLSDILLSEVTSMSDNFGAAVTQINQKVESLENQVQGTSQIAEQMNSNYQEVEQEIQVLIRGTQTKDRQYEQTNDAIQRLATQAEQEQNESKMMFDNIKMTLQNNQSQIDMIMKDKNALTSQIHEVKTKFQNSSTMQNNTEKKHIEIEEENKLAITELQIKLNEIKSQTQKDNSRNETINTIRELSSIVRSIEERMRSFDDSIDQSQKYVNHKIVEFESKQNLQSEEFQQDLEELALIYKESSSQIITNFDRALNSQHTELKYLIKRVDLLEAKQLQLNEEFQIKKWKEK